MLYRKAQTISKSVPRFRGAKKMESTMVSKFWSSKLGYERGFKQYAVEPEACGSTVPASTLRMLGCSAGGGCDCYSVREAVCVAASRKQEQ